MRETKTRGAQGAIGTCRVPVLGRVSMDLTAFDVTDVPEQILEQSNWIELFGPNVPVDEAASACGTIGYEMLTGIGNRYLREYTNAEM